jgi:hypothetical protein
VLSAVSDTEAADWVVAGVRDFDGTVGSVVPAVFDAYARVFHPASRSAGAGEAEVRWAEVAAANTRCDASGRGVGIPHRVLAVKRAARPLGAVAAHRRTAQGARYAAGRRPGRVHKEP